MKVLELFSGYGTPSFALNRLGISRDLVGYSDIDKYANQCFKQNHCPWDTEDKLQLGSATNIDPNKLRDFDLLTGGFPCSPAGTLVKTINGYVPIEEIQKEDYVLTHNNRFKPVVITMSKIANHINTIKGVGCYDLRLTDEHPVYISRYGFHRWVNVKDLNKETDCLIYNINKIKENKYNLTKKEAWLIGRYIADGSIDTRRRLYFSVGSHKRDEFDAYSTNYKKFVCHEDRNCQEHFIDDYRLLSQCEYCGVGSKDKEIPQHIINLPKDILMEFFNGYMAGDGHYDKNRDRFMYTTVSEKIALGMQDIIIKLFNKVPTISIRHDDRSPTFNNTFNSQVCGTQKDIIVENDRICVKIKSIEREEKNIEVFNFEVEDDNSYTLNNVIVHNCQAFSIAGKGLGELDTRGTLFNEIIRIAEVKKPRYMLLENVKGLISKKHKPTFDKIISELYRIGYFVKWKILNTKEHGIPQNRERIFFTCFRRWEDFCNYEWPQTEELTLFLKDILEDEVEEKFYLANEKVEALLKSTFNSRRALYQGTKKVCSCLAARDYKEPKNVAIPVLTPDRLKKRQNGRRFKEDGEPMFTLNTQDKHGRLQINKGARNGRRVYNPEGCSPTLAANSGGLTQDRAIILQRPHGANNGGVRAKDGVVPTITSGASWEHNNYLMSEGYTIRKLTPRECFRLQGFLNDEVNLEGISNSQQYKMAGNGQSVNVVEKILKNMLGVENE